MPADTTHPCPGCDAPGVPQHQLGCRPCWWRLPEPIRGRINRAYAAKKRHPHDVDIAGAHRRAIFDAMQWWRDNKAVGRG